MLVQNAHPRDKNILFKETGHIYTINGISNYKSVTTWLNSYFEKFEEYEKCAHLKNIQNIVEEFLN